MPIGEASVELELEGDLPMPESVELLDGWEALDDRRRELLPAGGLRAKKVVLAGAGTVGSDIGLLLAQAGVGKFRIADIDWLNTANVSRHVCDIADLGREKHVALAEKFVLRGVEASGESIDLAAQDTSALESMFGTADLVVATTDSPAAQFAINEAVVSLKKPAVFVGAYERACAGEIVVVRPGNGPCLFCGVGFRAGVSADLQLQDRRGAYQSADQNRLDAEPGLAIDISFIASVAAAHCLALLDPDGSRGDLIDDGGAFTLVHGPSRPRDTYADLFRTPLDLIRARVTTTSPCPVCGYDHPAEVLS